jgi:hypothetical protein
MHVFSPSYLLRVELVSCQAGLPGAQVTCGQGCSWGWDICVFVSQEKRTFPSFLLRCALLCGLEPLELSPRSPNGPSVPLLLLESSDVLRKGVLRDRGALGVGRA